MDSSERRKFKRVEADVAAKGKLTDPQKKTDISGDIEVKTKNLSETGALLEWPRSWPCDSCSNCLAWIHNFNCKLKDKETKEDEFDKHLVPEMHISLRLTPGNDIEPVEVLAKVTWVKVPEQPDAEKYDVGVSFVEEDRKEADIRKKITILKRRFEAN